MTGRGLLPREQAATAGVRLFMPTPAQPTTRSSCHPPDRGPARGVMARAKALLGHALLDAGEAFPALKPLVRPWGLRAWAQWQRDRAYHVGTPDGASFRLAGDNYLSFELFWKGTGYYEPISTRVTCELLEPGDTFLDIGANIGFYSLVLSTLKRRIAVVAFEPNPRNFALLQSNARLNGYANITCEPLALSDRPGTARLYLSQSDMSASLVPGFDDGGGEALDVRTTTLDAYLADHPPAGRLVLKVDVEGHEAAFFRGAARTIQTIRPDIVAEVALAYDRELTDFLRRAGYRFYPITDRGLLPAAVLQPVVRDRLVFLNHLLSTRSPAQAAQLFERIAPAVRRLDLRQTSKYLAPDAVARFAARAASHPAGNWRTSSGNRDGRKVLLRP